MIQVKKPHPQKTDPCNSTLHRLPTCYLPTGNVTAWFTPLDSGHCISWSLKRLNCIPSEEDSRSGTSGSAGHKLML